MSLVMGQAPTSLEVQTSDLYTKHLLDIGTASPVNQAFADNIAYLLDTLAEGYDGAGNLRDKLGEVCQRVNDGVVSSVRRAEIEILSAGKVRFDFRPCPVQRS